MAQAPYSLAMVICDAIHRDPTTGKATLLGCFSMLAAREFPLTAPQISVYAALTDGHGEVDVALRISDVDGEHELFRQGFPIPFGDPRFIHEIDFKTGPITFPQPGEYRFQLWAGEEFMIERRLFVAQL